MQGMKKVLTACQGMIFGEGVMRPTLESEIAATQTGDVLRLMGNKRPIAPWMQALDVLLSGRTAIVIAHRMATAMRADRIAVVDGGGIVELGTHDELVAAGGQYAAMYATWMRHVDGPGDDVGELVVGSGGADGAGGVDGAAAPARA